MFIWALCLHLKKLKKHICFGLSVCFSATCDKELQCWTLVYIHVYRMYLMNNGSDGFSSAGILVEGFM